MSAKIPASYFVDPAAGKAFLEYWNDQVMNLNGRRYSKLHLDTQYGETIVFSHEPEGTPRGTLVFFPGARTCSLFWDLDHGLAPLKRDYRIFLVEVNGQPSLSDGLCPDASVQTYGAWAKEVFEKLPIDATATILGASLGGIICMALSLVLPSRIERMILVNPGGIRSFSLGFTNVWHNFLPILLPNEKNLQNFFDKVVFHPPGHDVSRPYRQLCEEYMLYVLRNHKFGGKYPAPIGEAWLKKVQTDLYLILGDKDPLYPYKGTVEIAKAHIPGLKDIHVLPGVAHGIETSPAAIRKIAEILDQPVTIRPPEPEDVSGFSQRRLETD